MRQIESGVYARDTLFGSLFEAVHQLKICKETLADARPGIPEVLSSLDLLGGCFLSEGWANSGHLLGFKRSGRMRVCRFVVIHGDLGFMYPGSVISRPT